MRGSNYLSVLNRLVLSMIASLLPDAIYVTLVPENILSIRDSGNQVLD